MTKLKKENSHFPFIRTKERPYECPKFSPHWNTYTQYSLLRACIRCIARLYLLSAPPALSALLPIHTRVAERIYDGDHLLNLLNLKLWYYRQRFTKRIAEVKMKINNILRVVFLFLFLYLRGSIKTFRIVSTHLPSHILPVCVCVCVVPQMKVSVKRRETI